MNLPNQLINLVQWHLPAKAVILPDGKEYGHDSKLAHEQSNNQVIFNGPVLN